jgi:hypothetical protein
MGSAFLDGISPRYLREARIDLSLDPGDPPPAAFRSTLINISYARTLPEHVVTPLVLVVQGPSAQSYQRRVFGRTPPASVVFTPREGGPHRVILREAAHNRWWGELGLDVAGERLEAERPS